jgi:hypothetical protein
VRDLDLAAHAPPTAPGIGIELPDDLVAHFRIG